MTGERILVVDDEVGLTSSCQRLLNGGGYPTRTASNGQEALRLIAEEEPHLIVTDMRMPVMDGMDLLRQVREKYPDIQLIMMTAFSSVEYAVEAMRCGASDFVPKPFTPDHFRIVVEKVLRERRIKEENRSLRRQLATQRGFDNIIGKSTSMQAIFGMIAKIAETNINVLISGASGTGKELIARSIHSQSNRKDSPFIPINCGALPDQLVESEIFGYEKGAFTGAEKSKQGLLEAAHGGTFFMDEVAEMPIALQVKFLRVLEDGCFRKVGSNKEQEVDIRLVCATNRDLNEMVDQGDFREDLFYRINSFSIEIPSLKSRQEDILPLVTHFIKRYKNSYNKDINGVSAGAVKVLLAHPWKGNVRELDHVIERAVILSTESEVQAEDLAGLSLSPGPQSPATKDASMQLSYKDGKSLVLEEFEREYVEKILSDFDGNISKAAEFSGINRRTLHRLLVKHELHNR